MNKERIYINHSPKPTLGVEAELYTILKDTSDLYPGSPPILNLFKDDLQVKEESLECIIEINTGICNDVGKIRVCDSVPTVKEMVNLVSLIQGLVVVLSEYYDEGSQFTILDPWDTDWNKWHATCYWIDAEIIIDESGKLQPFKDIIKETINKLIPIAKGLGCRKELEELGNLVENNKVFYKRQILQYKKIMT